MATITLAGNTNYSALTVADGDTIALAGFALTFDANPTAINVIVQSPGSNGTIVIGSPNTYDFTGWTFTAGNATLLTTLSAGKTVGGTWIGGGSNTRAIATNSGTINGDVRGGSGANSYGVNINSGTINGNVRAQNGDSAFGVSTNNGTINGNVTGGTVSNGRGLSTNNGLINGHVTGGSAFSTHGVGINNGSICGNVTGGTTATANGVGVCYGIIDGAIINGTGAAIGTFPPVFFARGNLLQTTVPSTVQKFYSFGEINPFATNNAVATTILSEGGGTSGFTGLSGVGRLGT
jgi:hypothetical protein